jgi:hypothetical protein
VEKSSVGFSLLLSHTLFYLESSVLAHYLPTTVRLTEGGVRVPFGSCSFVGQNVGNDTFIAAFRGVIHCCIGSSGEALQNRAGAAPGSHVLRSSAGCKKLSLRGRNADFDFFAYLRNATSAFLIQPKGRFGFTN